MEHVTPAADQTKKQLQAQQKQNCDDVEDRFEKPCKKAAGIFALRLPVSTIDCLKNVPQSGEQS
jgi:hypothetical protein